MKVPAIICGLLLVGSSAFAADVSITITVPEAVVPRIAALANADLNCGESSIKDCVKAELIRHLRYLVKTYEAGLIIAQSQNDIDAIQNPDIE